MKHNDLLYSGGLSEFVSSPSPLTLSFFSYWFTGQNSVGKAMKLLSLPYQPSSLPLLVNSNGQIVVHGRNEEKTLYEKTIFAYSQKLPLSQPVLHVSFSKILSPLNVQNSLQLLLTQSRWLANKTAIEKKASNLVEHISDTSSNIQFEKQEEILIENVWPAVIAIGMLSEFFHQYVVKEAGKECFHVLQYAAQEIAKADWFFRSLADQEKVKKKEMGFGEYMTIYGIRSDHDYELGSPRWYEIKNDIQKRIEKQTIPQKKHFTYTVPNRLKQSVHTLVVLSCLRSEAKRKTLIHLDHFRKLLIEKVGSNDISSFTREDIIAGVSDPKKNEVTIKEKSNFSEYPQRGKGRSVSIGKVTGVIKNITQVHEEVAGNCIGIFPNASPQFAQQFPKCVGIIFLQGGQTSHGAIVAREFGIPALIDQHANIPTGKTICIDGTTGEWEIIK